MSSFELLFFAALLIGVPAILFLAFSRQVQGSYVLAVIAAVSFGGFSALTVTREGILGFLPNHVSSLWGLQVWYDLVICLTVALTFIVPRARAVGMNVAPWVLACGLTASIALLPMIARLFWLERQSEQAS